MPNPPGWGGYGPTRSYPTRTTTDNPYRAREADTARWQQRGNLATYIPIWERMLAKIPREDAARYRALADLIRRSKAQIGYNPWGEIRYTPAYTPTPTASTATPAPPTTGTPYPTTNPYGTAAAGAPAPVTPTPTATASGVGSAPPSYLYSSSYTGAGQHPAYGLPRAAGAPAGMLSTQQAAELMMSQFGKVEQEAANAAAASLAMSSAIQTQMTNIIGLMDAGTMPQAQGEALLAKLDAQLTALEAGQNPSLASTTPTGPQPPTTGPQTPGPQAPTGPQYAAPQQAYAPWMQYANVQGQQLPTGLNTAEQYGSWVQQFQAQHPTIGGQTYPNYPVNPETGQTQMGGQPIPGAPTGYASPEDYYAQTGEGLGTALQDLAWSQKFLSDTGHAPNEYDWKLHWYQSHGYGSGPMGGGGQGKPQRQQSSWAPPEVYYR